MSAIYINFLLITTFASILPMVFSDDPIAILRESHEKFAFKIASVLSYNLESAKHNVVISPILVQTLLVLLYYGIKDDQITANALKYGLALDDFPNKQAVINNFAALLSVTRNEVGENVHLGSAIYAHDHFAYGLKAAFIKLADEFNITVEQLNLNEGSKSYDKINFWFLKQTQHEIGEIITSSTLHESPDFLLVAALAFKAPWAIGFNIKDTEKLNFYSDFSTFKLSDFMFVKNEFRYAEIERLDAKAIEIPFEHTSMKMLLLYPNEIDGLAQLESKLRNESLTKIRQEMSVEKLALTMPKFRVEHNTNLNGTLKALGLSAIFDESAQFENIFSALFTSLTPHVSRFQHKVVLQIDETGGFSETGFSLSDLFSSPTQVLISHPFYFAITTNDAVLLTGHIVNI